MFGAAGAALTLGCGGDSPTSPTTTGGGATAGGAANAACAVTPSETAGPFPSLTDLIRSDIREGKSGTTNQADDRRRQQQQRLQSGGKRQRGNLAVSGSVMPPAMGPGRGIKPPWSG